MTVTDLFAFELCYLDKKFLNAVVKLDHDHFLLDIFLQLCRNRGPSGR